MRRLLIVLLASTLCSGCAIFTRTIYVPDGKTIRLRQKVVNVKVWVKEVGGNTAEGRMDLQEGWYCKSRTEGAE